ncbi:hypothetical protein BTJ40_13265 [Microbulbifer sp. A4B17]|nr:hypothetical protein BTJ40_13265 [Microbulbifer sp. A4B17]
MLAFPFIAFLYMNPPEYSRVFPCGDRIKSGWLVQVGFLCGKTAEDNRRQGRDRGCGSGVRFLKPVAQIY